NNVLSSAVVRTGTWSGGPVAGQTPTSPFISMNLTGSYVYDPSSGNDLIIQVEKCGGGTVWGVALDGAFGPPAFTMGDRYGHTTSCSAASSNFNNNAFAPIVRLTYTPAPTQAADLALDAITAPQGVASPCASLGAAETLSVRIKNAGLNPVPAGTMFNLSFDRDAGTQQAAEARALAATLAPGASVVMSFTTPIDLSVPGPHMVLATVGWASDTGPSNDTKSAVIDAGGAPALASFPVIESFDSFGASPGSLTPPPGWSQSSSDAAGPGSDWEFRDGPGPNPGTGPAADFDTQVTGQGFFASVVDGGDHAAVSLLSPCLNLTGLSAPTLVFRLHSNNVLGTSGSQNMFSLDVVSSPTGLITPNVLGPIGHLGDFWSEQTVDLSAFAGTTIRLQFRASSNGGGPGHDLAIDALRVIDMVPGLGQAPRTALAIFDINASKEANGFGTDSLRPGPYFAEASLTGQVQFHFEGQPNQAILLFGGPLNAGLIHYNGIGTLDIGTSFDPFTLLPNGLTIVADGLSPAFPNSLFRTAPWGQTTISFPTPVLPLGVLSSYQPVIFNGQSTVVSLANAVQLTIVP
ncbi:MAG: hypothetical protein KDB53_05140, partial [Planctomycetes bacterium]|nr:hypothetical protein [Planctomycetota bacterium]